MKKNRILFLIHLPPPIHGSSMVGSNIKRNVAINQAFACNYINLLASRSMTETGVINFKKVFGLLITLIRVSTSLIFKRPDLCYLALSSTGIALYKDLLIITLLKIFRVKRVYHLHNKGISLRRSQRFNRFCYRYLFDNAEVIVLSKRLYSDIRDYVPEERVYVCPNGVDDYNNILRESKGESQNYVETQVPKILFLSNLFRSKGVFVLLESLAMLKKRNILFECSFVGGEGDVTPLELNEQKDKLGLNGLVSYQGKKYGEDKRKAFSEADIFVFPTYYYNECFPLVLLEAMSFSLPVISTFEGSICDIVDDGITGFIVPQRNVELLAEKLELMIKESSLRRNMGIAGRRKFEQQFTLDIFERTFVMILKAALGE